MNFTNTLADKYNISLNEQQKKAVTHVNGPALVLAGPGSGKTTVIISRTAHLVMELGVSPESILTVTFNRAAKYEMERRYKNVFGQYTNQRVHFSTLHSFCNLVVRDYENRQGKRLKRIEGSEDSEENKRKIIRNIFQQMNGSLINDDELENLINEIGLVKNKMIKDFDGQNFTTRNFSPVFKAYEDYKRSNLLIDFDDMLTYAYSILVKCPDILIYYKNKYRYIQVDEGQDLSKIQFEILKLLVKSNENNLFIVADDDQSIYGFRGAEPQYILDIAKQFTQCSLYRLEQNYRSTKNIVELSSSFIKNNTKRYDKNHKTDNGYKSDPVLVQVKDENEQSNLIVEIIKKQMQEDKNREIAILYRNNLSSISVADELDRRGVKFNVKQGKLFFFNHWIVLDILAFLKFALDQTDKYSFSRIYFKMNRFISKAMMEYALNSQIRESVVDAVLASDEVKPFQRKLIAEIKNEFKSIAKMQTLSAFKYIETEFRYFDSVKDYCESTGLSFDYFYNLFGILKIIASAYPIIPDFLQRLAQLENMFTNSKSEWQKSNVTLTTIHSSKGLEYDCVLMVSLTDDEIPGSRAIELANRNNNNDLLEEERRLFYVGMTRAKEQLYLLSPLFSNNSMVSRSIFINELVSCINRRMVDDIGEGIIVTHKHFGEGIITAILEQADDCIMLEIDFKGIRRKLDFITCMDKGLLSI